MVFPEHMDGLV